MAIQTHPVELRKLPGTTVWWPPDIAGQGEGREGVAVYAFQALIQAQGSPRSFNCATP
jgi:sulfate permease, SulP family